MSDTTKTARVLVTYRDLRDGRLFHRVEFLVEAGRGRFDFPAKLDTTWDDGRTPDEALVEARTLR